MSAAIVSSAAGLSKVVDLENKKVLRTWGSLDVKQPICCLAFVDDESLDSVLTVSVTGVVEVHAVRDGTQLLHTQLPRVSEDIPLVRVLLMDVPIGPAATAEGDQGKEEAKLEEQEEQEEVVTIRCLVSADAAGNVRFTALSELYPSLPKQPEGELPSDWSVGKVSCFEKCTVDGDLIACGGEENDISVWSLRRRKRLWKARNLPHNFLDLRSPVWPTAVKFHPTLPNLLMVGTAYHQVRLYDWKKQRRPIKQVVWKSLRIVNIAVHESYPGFAVVSNGKGDVAQMWWKRLKITAAYKGYAGSVRAMAIDTLGDSPRLIAAGLDRFVHVHQLQGLRAQTCKIYVKQKINRLIVVPLSAVVESQAPAEALLPGDATPNAGAVESAEEGDEEDWALLARAKDKRRKRAKRVAKRARQKAEQQQQEASTEEAAAEGQAMDIKQEQDDQVVEEEEQPTQQQQQRDRKSNRKTKTKQTPAKQQKSKKSKKKKRRQVTA